MVVTGDKGLCGAFNANVQRAAGAFLRDAKERGVEEVRLVTVGRKACDFWKRRTSRSSRRTPASSRSSATTRQPASPGRRRSASSRARPTRSTRSTTSSSVISQVIRTKRLLPVQLEELAAATPAVDPQTLQGSETPPPTTCTSRRRRRSSRGCVPRHLEFQIYRILLESNAAEHAARMTAMDAASKNAGEMIDDLTLTYNRARQAASRRNSSKSSRAPRRWADFTGHSRPGSPRTGSAPQGRKQWQRSMKAGWSRSSAPSSTSSSTPGSFRRS